MPLRERKNEMLRQPTSTLRATLTLCCLTTTFATSAAAEAGAIKSGVRGRVIVAPELSSATHWPARDEIVARVTAGARVRRPSGHAAPQPLLLERLPLVIVLEGVRHQQAVPPTELRVEGQRFVPAEVVLPRPGRLRLTNAHRTQATVRDSAGAVIAALPPGESAEIDLDVGEHTLTLTEYPFARAQVRALGPSRVLTVTRTGDIPAVPVDEGDYQLAFYEGARALQVQTLQVPASRYVAIDGSVSANGVVTVSVKEGDLQVAAPTGSDTPSSPGNTGDPADEVPNPVGGEP